MNQLNLDLIDAFAGSVFDEPILKHGEHDQKTHGSWATGGTIATGIIDRLGKKGVTGFSLDISSRTEPTSGYMCSNAGAEQTVAYDDFFSSRDSSRKVILDYIEKNADALSERGAYFGIWVVKEQGTVYLDVSRRYDSRGEAVRAGFDNDQQSVYDIEKDDYIYMKDEEDDRTRKAVDDGSSNPRQSNDSRTEASLRGGDSQRNREESPHICLGRHQGVEKHLEGQHDQATHGSWASGRFGEDSVKSARDGAKEYAFKAGIKQDDSIDYQKTVANRARAGRIADAYDELPTVQEEAFPAYEALATEVEAQFDYMTKTLGIKVEFVADDPYKTSREMFADVSKGVLKVLSTASTGSHPFLSDEQNDKFRAVHDFFGHAATGRGFGQDGEESAWVHHSQMFTETARGALTTETRGQNSWYNSRGKVFAEQKVALLPKEFWEVPETFEKQYKVIKFQAGLIPILKHEEHDQRTHGSWANQGFTSEEEARISEMSSMGPALADLDEILDSVNGAGSNPSMDDFRLIVENDQGMYQEATEDIDARVQERLANLQAEFPNHVYTEQEKSTIYEDVQREMIEEFIDNNSDDLHAEFAASRGGGDTETLLGQAHAFFDDVYTYDYEVKGPNGESGTMSSIVGSVEIGDHPYDGSQSAIKLTGTIQFDGDYAGEFERTFWKDENGNWNVEHDLFKLEDEYQGTGFGKSFIQRQEDWYTAAGFKSIEVGTGWDGARHWARAGYDFNERYQESNMNQLVSAMNVAAEGGFEFEQGSPERAEFDSLMSRATVDYVSDADGGQFTSIRSLDVPSSDVPIPNDFAMIGYDRRTAYTTTNAMGEEVTAYAWAGKTLLQNLNLKYKKGLTAEGRSIIDGPIDRDGDGLVYDGTPREKPASRVNS
jgi:GNAT superfamily N-acetyltransferase